jgi:hypothetical protein
MLRRFSLAIALAGALAFPSAALAGPGGGHGGGGWGGHGGGGWGGHGGGGWGGHGWGWRGGGWGHPGWRGQGRYWRGRWWPYGVGSCWRYDPFFARWVWACY